MIKRLDMPGTLRWLFFALALWCVAASFYWVGGAVTFHAHRTMESMDAS
ncbi:MAG: hypothetical protein HYY48_07805 [Gammaproteobacteria bacterium]|nr:hypothetical protein [Gammaproteobacteria bacterium]